METKTYFFQPEKKVLKQGYFMEDEDKNVVYEAKMLKQPLLGPMVYDFINHKTTYNEEHKVGHTMTSSYSGGVLDFFSTKSSFKFDGKNIWDYLHEKGVRIESNISTKSVGMTYTVSFEGKEIATLVMVSPNGGKILVGDHWYKVTTTEDNLDLAFLVTFAIAKTDQVVYD